LVQSLPEDVDSVQWEKSIQWHTGNSLRALPQPLKLPTAAHCLDFDPLGERIFVGCGNGVLTSFRVGDAGSEGAVLGQVPGLSEVLCTPNGKSLLTAGERGLELWDIRADGRPLLKTSRLLTAEKVDCLAVSPCSDSVLAGVTTAEGSRLVDIDLQLGAAMPIMELPKRLGRLLISGDGKRLAAISNSCQISLFQRTSYQASWRPIDFPVLGTIALPLVSLSPDSPLLITSDRAGPTLLIWDLESKTVCRSLNAPMDYLNGCTFLDASHVITWGFNRKRTKDSPFPQHEVQVIEL
jgi:WD40 repeat protein